LSIVFGVATVSEALGNYHANPEAMSAVEEAQRRSTLVPPDDA
jgi:hypothetical protein